MMMITRKNRLFSYAVLIVTTALLSVLIMAGCAAELAPDASGSDGETPYAEAGVNDPEAFRRMFEAVKDAVARGDQETVAENTLFPLIVNTGKLSVRIASKEDFIRQYDRIFTPSVRDALAAQEADKLHVTRKGVTTANGEVWFGASADTPQRYGIITVNAGASR